MKETNLFGDFVTGNRPIYECLAEGLIQRHYSVIDGFFAPEHLQLLRKSLVQKYRGNQFKKAAAGNAKTDKLIAQSIRNDAKFRLDRKNYTKTESRILQTHDILNK